MRNVLISRPLNEEFFELIGRRFDWNDEFLEEDEYRVRHSRGSLEDMVQSAIQDTEEEENMLLLQAEDDKDNKADKTDEKDDESDKSDKDIEEETEDKDEQDDSDKKKEEKESKDEPAKKADDKNWSSFIFSNKTQYTPSKKDHNIMEIAYAVPSMCVHELDKNKHACHPKVDTTCWMKL